MRLFIAEKPELARAIVAGLGGGQKQRKHYNCENNTVVTWCIGHLIDLYDPVDYDRKYKSWDIKNLPFFFYPVKYKFKSDKSIQSQAKHVLNLIQNADEIIHAGDPDREGQLIIDSMIEHANYKGPVLRFETNDNSLAIIKKSLTNLKPNAEFKGISNAGKARLIADQLFGYNFTMAITHMYKSQGGKDDLISIGRVQTPLLALIVNRTLANKNHKKSFYYTITTKDDKGNTFKLVPEETYHLNDAGDFLDKTQAHKVYDSLGSNFNVISINTSQHKEHQPLPYNMINLQMDASKKLDIPPDKTSKITQVLREKYSLITYNGTDCSYLNDVHHNDAADIFKTVFKQFNNLDTYHHNFDIKGRCFNDAKVTAHHAIIPTGQNCDLSELSDNERAVYELICIRYLIQFFEPAHYTKKEIVLNCAGHSFKGTSKYYSDLSFLKIIKPNSQIKDYLSHYNENDSFKFDAFINQVETKPPKLYTFDTIMKDLTQIAKYINNPNLKKILIEKDKGVKGENGGIGTARTRDQLIKTLFDRHFIYKKKKNIMATKKGIELIQQLPKELTSPDMSALWHEQFKLVESGNLDVKDFLDNVFSFIANLVNEFKNKPIKFEIKRFNCTKCKSILNQLYSKDNKSHFWLCPECKSTYDDLKNEPVLK